MTRIDRDEILRAVENAEEVHACYEDVEGHYVRCPRPEWDDQCPPGLRGVYYARNESGGHAHYRKYEAPHRRLVLRLPAEPGRA